MSQDAINHIKGERAIVYQSLEEYKAKWDSGHGPLMHEILDPAYEKLGHEAVNKIMAEVAEKLTAFTGVDVRWHNIKDAQSWLRSDHGDSYFYWRKPKLTK